MKTINELLVTQDYYMVIKKVMLTQPNFSWFGKRTWKLLPYNLGLLNASLKKAGYDSWIFDPNFNNLSEQNVIDELRLAKPDAIGITTFSSEYIREPMLLSKIIKEELPNSIIILGGILPTVLLEKAMEDPNVDYFMIGEGEYRLPMLLYSINMNSIDGINNIDGLAYVESFNQLQPIIHLNQMKDFIQSLDNISFPDYGDLDLSGYTNYTNKYIAGIIPRQFPFATTMSSRGCSYRCIFCASATVSGRKVRLRSAENVLQEIDELHNRYQIKEIIFWDDHFLANRQRSIDIMNGIIERNDKMDNSNNSNQNNKQSYGLTWKCVNINVNHLDRDILELMKKSGCYQITISVESGNPYVLKNIIKKPLNLEKIPIVLDIAKELGFEICANFVIGFPGETWEQIRDTFRYAEKLNVDYVSFHIATPLPKTELMEICKNKGYLKLDDIEGEKMHCYTKGVIQTPDFTPTELQILRAFEWDRINFDTDKKKQIIARMQGITLDELEEWRINTRRSIGITI